MGELVKIGRVDKRQPGSWIQCPGGGGEGGLGSVNLSPDYMPLSENMAIYNKH